MSGRVTNSLSREKIQQLLKAVGSEPTEDITQVEAAEYNWHEPHYFNSEQLEKLDNFAQTAANAVAEKFSKFCRSELNVTIESTTQHFADEFLNQSSDSEQKDYYLSFGANQELIEQTNRAQQICPRVSVYWAPFRIPALRIIAPPMPVESFGVVQPKTLAPRQVLLGKIDIQRFARRV